MLKVGYLAIKANTHLDSISQGILFFYYFYYIINLRIFCLVEIEVETRIFTNLEMYVNTK